MSEQKRNENKLFSDAKQKISELEVRIRVLIAESNDWEKLVKLLMQIISTKNDEFDFKSDEWNKI
ncbi:hypothetical protein [Spiroplasma endosymbiont of Poecilobothrus nobilitatus]|uniref:hypothetical protein n=1 Tax=Spiroplasma endosymbiont of Poecilobothrus nobilitatus TaxID=1209220 RepID=UPI00313BBA37